jgi:hypothetical protein
LVTCRSSSRPSFPPHCMRVAFLNAGSLHNSLETVAAFFISTNLDILFITETRPDIKYLD